jgi:hypothetical protein
MVFSCSYTAGSNPVMGIHWAVYIHKHTYFSELSYAFLRSFPVLGFLPKVGKIHSFRLNSKLKQATELNPWYVKYKKQNSSLIGPATS